MAYHSFKKYIEKRFDNELWDIALKCIEANLYDFDFKSYKLRWENAFEVDHVEVKHIWLYDLDNMRIKIDIALSVDFYFKESKYNDENYDNTNVWLMIECEGDLSKNLDDFKIKNYKKFDKKNKSKKPLSDNLVPIIKYNEYEDIADELLNKHYPEALSFNVNDKVDARELANRLGLNIIYRTIKDNLSVYGQVYFEDSKMKIYDENLCEYVEEEISAKTIVIDSRLEDERGVGSVNYTIAHECIHWLKHRKVYALEKLYNPNLSTVCDVSFDFNDEKTKGITHHIENQANKIAPRMLMPKNMFIDRAKKLVQQYLEILNAKYEYQVIEHVIDKLAKEFNVSKQSVKIRLVDLGFNSASNAYIYINGNHVKPHSFKEDALEYNETFSVSFEDVVIESFRNLEFRKLLEKGDYIFVDNHFVYDSPLYVETKYNKPQLTEYALSHMDECCLKFKIKVISKVNIKVDRVCFLNRIDENIKFDIKFEGKLEKLTPKLQEEYRDKIVKEQIEIYKQMTNDREQCIKLLLKWNEMTQESLANSVGVNPRTIRRILAGETNPSIETSVLICLGMQLPPNISERLIQVLGCNFNLSNESHIWLKHVMMYKYRDDIKDIREFLLIHNVKI